MRGEACRDGSSHSWPRPDPPGAEGVWLVPPGRKARPRARHLALAVFLLVPMALTATLGTISFSAPDGTAIASFWPAAAFQIVFSIWFGVYGAAAGIVGPMLGNGLVGASPFLYVAGNAVQSCLAGLWFRYRRLDPRLRGRRDWHGLILVGILLASALGAAAGVTESHLRGPAAGGHVGGLHVWRIMFLRWLGANTIPCLVLVPAMLKVASPMIVRGMFFCQSFWGGLGSGSAPRGRLRLSDLSMVAKLLLLTVVAGVLPLCVVAGWSVWDTMARAERLAAENTRETAREIRNEIERHEMLLGTWRAQLDDPRRADDAREGLLAEWRLLPGTFKELAIADLERAKARMPPEVRRAFADTPVVFYATGGDRPPDLWGAARLASAPGEALVGRVAWRGDAPPGSRWQATEAVLVLDRLGNRLHWHGPAELADWRPDIWAGHLKPYTIRHGGRSWHVAEARLEPLGWRFVVLASARKAAATVLANVPNTLAAMINFAIFGCFIGGSALARRISDRALAIAEHVRRSGAEPGKLQIPIGGRDELGYLGETLNRMSRDLAENVRRLRETTAEKERLAAEMELARQVQQEILPDRPPDVSGYEFAAASHPAREVGGDFFDYFLDAEGRAVLMIGDAAGKGLKAAMFITEVHGFARAAALDRPTPEKVLGAINAAMISGPEVSSDFVTMICAVLQPGAHRLLYASAGHNPPILLGRGQARELSLGSLPLAVSERTDFQLHQLTLAPGEAVIMYTDGVTEAFNADDEPFEVERLRDVAVRHAGASAAELLDAVLEAVREFSAGAPQSDDVTVLILRRRE